MNGNGSAHHAPEVSGSKSTENIFLFWPNIIGMQLPLAVPLKPSPC